MTLCVGSEVAGQGGGALGHSGVDLDGSGTSYPSDTATASDSTAGGLR